MNRYAIAAIALAPATLLAGCIQVKAPTSRSRSTSTSISRQEVVVRLEKDVQDLIKTNPGVF